MKIHDFILVMCEDEQCSLWVKQANPNLINKSICSFYPAKEKSKLFVEESPLKLMYLVFIPSFSGFIFYPLELT